MMKNVLFFLLLCGLAGSTGADTSNTSSKIHPPYFLKAQDKVPNHSLACPAVTLQGSDGQPLDAQVNIIPPDSATLDQFSDPSLFEEIQRVRPSEGKVQRFYWHTSGNGLGYCHFKDMEGNNWYGWTDADGNFNWVLWRGKRFWWHDPFAKHWLYYFQGYWWWAGGQKKNLIQTNINGEYYTCDAQGNLLQDMGQDGKGAIISAPGRYKGDFHHGGHSDGDGDHDHGGGPDHDGQNQGQPSQNAPQGGNGQGSNSSPTGGNSVPVPLQGINTNSTQNNQ